MNIINFAADVIRNITIVDAGAAFAVGTFVYFAAHGWQTLMAKIDQQPQLSAEQAERAEDVRSAFESAAPIAIVTSAAMVLVLVIVGAVAVWQMAIR